MPNHDEQAGDQFHAQLDQCPPVVAPSYRHVAPVYDALASAYSLGAIDRAKWLHHDLIRPADRVLYVGAGRGAEIVDACQRGAAVTCVEPCPAMATRLHKRLSRVADNFMIVPKPIQTLAAEPAYDLVVAHFFLNVFSTREMPGVLTRLCNFIRPGGHLVIADFKPNEHTTAFAAACFRHLYYRPVNLAGWALRIGALHPIYDYEPTLKENGMTTTSRDSFMVLPGLPALYETMIAKKQPPPCGGG